MGHWLKAAVVASVVFAAAACTTPSVPIPPPSPELMTFDVDVDSGQASFQYDANPDFSCTDPSCDLAVVYVFNRSAGSGIIATARPDGSVGPTAPFPAVDNDEVVISFEQGAQFVATCVRVADGRSSAAAEYLP